MRVRDVVDESRLALRPQALGRMRMRCNFIFVLNILNDYLRGEERQKDRLESLWLGDGDRTVRSGDPVRRSPLRLTTGKQPTIVTKF